MENQQGNNQNIQNQTNLSTLLAKDYFKAYISGMYPRYADKTFDNYIVNNQNAKQVEACRDGSGSFTLTGKSGTGKTHLAISIMRNLKPVLIKEKRNWEKQQRLFTQYANSTENKERAEFAKMALETEAYKYRGQSCLFLPAIKFFMEANELAIKGESKKDYLYNLTKRYNESNSNEMQFNYDSGYDCVCLDDFGAEKLSEATRQNLYYFIDERYRNMLSTIVTTNYTIEQVNEVEPRVASRLAEMGKILLFNGDDYRIKK